MNCWPQVNLSLDSEIQPEFGLLPTCDWKLFWRTLLPQAIELYNPGKPVRNEEPRRADIVATLQERGNELGAEAKQPILLEIEFANIFERMHL